MQGGASIPKLGVAILILLSLVVCLTLVNFVYNVVDRNSSPPTSVPEPLSMNKAKPTPAHSETRKPKPSIKSKSSCDHGGALALLPSGGRCTEGVANVDTGACSNVFGAPSACSTQNKWTYKNEATFPIESVGSEIGADTCSTGQFTVTITNNGDGFHYIKGNAKFTLTNNGRCKAELTSVLLILEQAVPSGTGNSYGPGGKNHKAWAISGMENTAIVGNCNTSQQAQICSKLDSACNIPVPFAKDTIRDVHTGLVIDLSDYAVLPRSTCSQLATTMEVTYIFQVPDSDYDKMRLVGGTPFRITALHSIDTCCNHGAGCGINIDCSADGSLESIHTIQTRSSPFSMQALAFPCAAQCTEVKFQDALGAYNDQITDGCTGSFTPATAAKTFVVSTQGETKRTHTDNVCCKTLDCACTRPDNGNLSYHVGRDNAIAPLTICTDIVSGESLIKAITPPGGIASGAVQCAYPTPKDCTYGEWSTWGSVAAVMENCRLTSDDVCRLRTVRTRVKNGEECHGGKCTGELTQYDCAIDCPDLSQADVETCGCVLGPWTEWSSCSSEGNQSRTRAPVNQGPCDICETETQVQDCQCVRATPCANALVPSGYAIITPQADLILEASFRLLGSNGYEIVVEFNELLNGIFKLVIEMQDGEQAPAVTVKEYNGYQNGQFLSFYLYEPVTSCNTKIRFILQYTDEFAETRISRVETNPVYTCCACHYCPTGEWSPCERPGLFTFGTQVRPIVAEDGTEHRCTNTQEVQTC